MSRFAWFCRKILLVCVLLTMCGRIPVSADTDAADVTTVDSGGLTEEETKNKMLSAVLLLSTVSGAMIIAALIWRGVDKTKYL